MRFKITLLALAGMVLAMTASTAWAGQVNLVTATTANTSAGTFADTVLKTVADQATFAGTLTVIDTALLSNIAQDTTTGSYATTATALNTALKSLIDSRVGGGAGGTHIVTLATTNTAIATALTAGTYANTTVNTLATTNTAIMTQLQSMVLSVVTTLAETNTGSFADTVLETIIYAGQPADVSIEISQAGMTYSSPNNNSLTVGSLENNVAVAATAGVTQVNANAGNANVSVASNAVLDGGSLVALAGQMDSEAALKELGVLTLVPGFAVQNSNAATVAHISGLALAAAEKTVVTAVDIAQSDIAEYSPTGNVTRIGGAARNNVSVAASAGVTQVNANVGSANVAAAHNVLLVNTGPGGGGVSGINN